MCPPAKTRLGLVALALLGLAACGGGGGGGGSPGPAPSPTPPQNPPAPANPLPVFATPPSATLTSANSTALGSLAAHAIEQAAAAGEMAAFVAQVAFGRGGTGFCVGPIAPGTPFTVVDADGNGAPSIGDRLVSDYFACEGRWTGTLTLRLTAFDLGTQRIEGALEFNGHNESGSRVFGTAALALGYGAPRRVTLTDVAIALTKTNGEQSRVLDARFERAGDITHGFELTFSGRVESQALNATYAFDTPAALAHAVGKVPTDGSIVLSAGSTKARFDPTTELDRRDDTTDLALDSGSGNYAAAAQVPWARLVDGVFFAWIPNTRPRVTSLAVAPTPPTVLDDLHPVMSAEDADLDTLYRSFEWSVNGVRVPGFPDMLEATSFRKGDRIDLVGQAADGSKLDRKTVTFTIADAAPRDVVVTVSPAAPRSEENLSVAWTASDPDGDALTATYEWRRNGSPIAGQTTAALPRTAFAKNDVVTAVVKVGDGERATSGEADVTVGDTPAYVTVPAPPTSVQHGNVATFSAVAADYDGDSTAGLHFLLAYGPAGMTVNPATGLVSWTANGPMFTTSTSMSWGVTVDQPGATVATGTLDLADGSREAPFMRSGLGFPASFGALQVADLDGDGDLETLVSDYTTVYELERTPAAPGYRQSWTYLLGFGELTQAIAMAHADVDGDGHHEIFIAAGNTILQLDGVHRRVTHSVTLPIDAAWICGDLEIGDLNNDGVKELVCLAASGGRAPDQPSSLLVLDATTLGLIKQYPDAVYGASIAIGNVDTDAALEIVTGAGRVYDGNAVFGAGTATQGSYAPGFGLDVQVGDVSGDAVAEVVAFATGAVRAFNAPTATPTVLWSIADPDILAIALTNLTGDARPELLLGQGSNGGLRVANIVGYNHAVAATTAPTPTFTLSTGPANFSGVACVAAGDLDGDGNLELIWGAGVNGNILAIDRATAPATEEWRSDSANPPDVMGGFGGGELAHDTANVPYLMYLAVTGNSNGIRIAALNPADGTLRFGPDFGSNAHDLYVLAVANFDGDSGDETFVASEHTDAADNAFYVSYDLWRSSEDWRSANFIGEMGSAGVAHGDLNGDGSDDAVVVTAEGVVRAYDVSAHTLLWQSSSFGAGRDIAVANLDGAGRPEIVVATNDRLIVLSAAGAPGASVDLPPQLADVEIADTDGDGTLEIIALANEPGSGSILRRFDRNLALLSTAQLPFEVAGVTLERSAFARKNLAVIDGGTTPRLVIVDPRSGTQVWRSPVFLGAVRKGGAQFFDIANNGNQRISVATALGIVLSR